MINSLNRLWQKPEKGGKTIWKGRDDEEVEVEILALQYYESHGCKGCVHLDVFLRFCHANGTAIVPDSTAKAES